ncbi:MAG TPA: hypothetical protein DCE42_17965 [Myxococcales bacterium]|nr:hypothetical protein [Deltaproteobacteria bacterium]HAA56656.1 hypothetical protein [Myxococcales bacterium]|tara:strand:- start:1232 stop:5290 length:4059 start_codon:yes stop_codon:yes gene_type:complete
MTQPPKSEEQAPQSSKLRWWERSLQPHLLSVADGLTRNGHWFFAPALLLIGLLVMWSPFQGSSLFLKTTPSTLHVRPIPSPTQHCLLAKWPNHTTEQVTQHVTKPLFSALSSLPGQKQIQQTTTEGHTRLCVSWHHKQRKTAEHLLALLRSAQRKTLPTQATLQYQRTYHPSTYHFGYHLEGHDSKGKPVGGWDIQALTRIHKEQILPVLQSTPGVASVTTFGAVSRTLQLRLQPERMTFYRVPLHHIQQALQTLDTRSSFPSYGRNGLRYTIHVKLPIRLTKFIATLPIKTLTGASIPLKQLATLHWGPLPRTRILSRDGADAVGGFVHISSDAEPFETLRLLKKKLAALALRLPKAAHNRSQVTIVPFFDRFEALHAYKRGLQTQALRMLLLLCLGVLLFLRHLRHSVLTIVLSISAVWGTFSFLQFVGFPLYMGTLLSVFFGALLLFNMHILFVKMFKDDMGVRPSRADAYKSSQKVSRSLSVAFLIALIANTLLLLPLLATTENQTIALSGVAWGLLFILLVGYSFVSFVLPWVLTVFFQRKRSTLEDSNAYLFYNGVIDICIMSVGWSILGSSTFLGWLWIIFGLYRLISRWVPFDVKEFLVGLFQWSLFGYLAFSLIKLWHPLGPNQGFLPNAVTVVLCILIPWLLMHLLRWISMPVLTLGLAMRKSALLLLVLWCCLGSGMGYGFERLFAWVPHSLEAIRFSPKLATDSTVWSFGKRVFPGFARTYHPKSRSHQLLLRGYLPASIDLKHRQRWLHRACYVLSNLPYVKQAVGYQTEDLTTTPSTFSIFVRLHPTKLHGTKAHKTTPTLQTLRRLLQKELSHTPGVYGVTLEDPFHALAHRPTRLQVRVSAPTPKQLFKTTRTIAKQLSKQHFIAPSSIGFVHADNQAAFVVRLHPQLLTQYALSPKQVLSVLQAASRGWTLHTLRWQQANVPITLQYGAQPQLESSLFKRISFPLKQQDVYLSLLDLVSWSPEKRMTYVQKQGTQYTTTITFAPAKGKSDYEAYLALTALHQRGLILTQRMRKQGLQVRLHAPSAEWSTLWSKWSHIALFSWLVLGLLVIFFFRDLRSLLSLVFAAALSFASSSALIWLLQQPTVRQLHWGELALHDITHLETFAQGPLHWVGLSLLIGLTWLYITPMLLECNQRLQWKHTLEERRELLIEIARRWRAPILTAQAISCLLLLPWLTSLEMGSSYAQQIAWVLIGGLAGGPLLWLLVPVIYVIPPVTFGFEKSLLPQLFIEALRHDPDEDAPHEEEGTQKEGSPLEKPEEKDLQEQGDGEKDLQEHITEDEHIDEAHLIKAPTTQAASHTPEEETSDEALNIKLQKYKASLAKEKASSASKKTDDT